MHQELVLFVTVLILEFLAAAATHSSRNTSGAELATVNVSAQLQERTINDVEEDYCYNYEASYVRYYYCYYHFVCNEYDLVPSLEPP